MGSIVRNVSLGDFIIDVRTEYTYTNLDGISYYTHRLYGIYNENMV